MVFPLYDPSSWQEQISEEKNINEVLVLSNRESDEEIPQAQIYFSLNI